MKDKNPKENESRPVDIKSLNETLKGEPKKLENIARIILNRPRLKLYGLNTYEKNDETCVFELISFDVFSRLNTILILFDKTGKLEELEKLSEKLIKEHENKSPIGNRELIDVVIITVDQDPDKLFLFKKSSNLKNKSFKIQILNILYRGKNRIGELFRHLENT